MSTATELEPEVLKARIERFRQVQSQIVTQVRRVIVGQEEVLDQVMIALFVGGHCLITGLPGTAKTLLVRTMAQTLGLVFKRIQFTPDLMPSDITGTDIIEEDPTNGHESQPTGKTHLRSYNKVTSTGRPTALALKAHRKRSLHY